MRAVHALSFVALIPLLVACSDDAVKAPTLSAGPAGATFDLPGGLGLTIPAGALSQEVEIGVEIVADLDAAGLEALPELAAAAPAVSVALTPHGTTFAQPVTLSLPYAGEPGNMVLLRLDDASDDSWEPVGPITFGDGKASVEIRQFSIYALVEAGTCPCYNGNQLRAFEAVGAQRVRDDGWRRTRDLITPSEEEKDQFTQMGLDWRDFFREESRYRSVQINYFPPAPAAQAAQLVTLLNEPSGEAKCTYYAEPGSEAFLSAFVPPQSTARGNLPAAQVLTCQALLIAAFDGEPAHEIGVAASGIPSGESLALALNGEAFSIGADAGLVFAPTTVREGTAYEVTIVTQPAGATCALDAAASGTVGMANITVLATCTAGPSVPATVTAACDGIATLSCAAFDADDCVDVLIEERDADSGACVTEADALFTCLADNVDATPPSVGCVDESPGFELAFPGPCDDESDDLETCRGL